MNGYRNERMNLNDVCAWLTGRGMAATGSMIWDMFNNHIWTENDLMRTDILKEIFEKLDPTGLLFRQMECDVTTYMFTTPVYKAHVD